MFWSFKVRWGLMGVICAALFVFVVFALAVVGSYELKAFVLPDRTSPQTAGITHIYKGTDMLEPIYAPDPREFLPQNGQVQAILKIATSQPVVFITIDDGVYKNYKALEYIKRHNIKITMFLNDKAISNDYDYFKRLQDMGSSVQNHTVNHHLLTKLNLNQQKNEICENASRFERVFSNRPMLFRPPYGAYNQDTLRAAHECNMKALVNWSVNLNQGVLYFQEGNSLKPGDIVLMHFRPELLQDFKVLQAELQKNNLTTAKLEEWIK